MSGTKKQVRVALVGISPANQVTLRGYLRVLLALDYELVWVPATENNVHLFVINNEFQSATSVARLLQNNHGTPVLYVRNPEDDVGSMTQNVLTLPLKQINLLKDWLFKTVPILSLNGSMPYVSQSTQSDSISAPSFDTKHLSTSKEIQDFATLIATIKELQKRESGLVELVEQNKIIAIIDKKRQKLWQMQSVSRVNLGLQVRPYYGEMPSDAFLDSTNWLWQLALHQGDMFTNLLDHTKRYQLRYWMKPLSSNSRRDTLQVMTALETTPLTIHEIYQRTGVPISTVKKVVASLLFSGSLTDSSYETLKRPNVATNATVDAPESTHSQEVLMPKTVESSQQPQVQNAMSQSQQQEKLGFLSRLRRKLGLG